MSIKDSKHVTKVAHPFHFITSGLVFVPIDFLGVPFNYAKKGGKMLRGELVAIIKQRRNELSDEGELEV